MGFTGPISLQRREAVYPGEWPRVFATKDPLGAPSTHELGAVYGGEVRVTSENVELMGTSWPRKLEMILGSQVGMSFAGNAVEITASLLHALSKDAEIDDPSQYIYIGAECPNDEYDVSITAERTNCYAQMLVAHIHRARATGAFTIGAEPDDAVKIAFEFFAMNDENGQFGGSVDDPYGWIWLTT